MSARYRSSYDYELATSKLQFTMELHMQSSVGKKGGSKLTELHEISVRYSYNDRTINMETVSWQEYFGFALPSTLRAKRVQKC